MAIPKQPSPQQALPSLVYILRLWQEPAAAGGAPDVWRISLQDPTTRSRRGFASLEELFDFLELIAHSAPPPQNNTPDPETHE